jgi:hypothetical protein
MPFYVANFKMKILEITEMGTPLVSEPWANW